MQADRQARRPQYKETGRLTKILVDLLHTDMKTDRQMSMFTCRRVTRQPEMDNLMI